MSKEWGTKVPVASKFVKAVPANVSELLTNLQELGANWAYVSYCGVVKQLKGIYVDLGTLANAKKDDFYLPLKALEVEKADTIVKAIVAKVDAKKPIVEQDAVALFPTIETP